MPFPFPLSKAPPRPGATQNPDAGRGDVHTGGTGKYNDPDNVSSDVTPADLNDPQTIPAEDERKWVEYVKERFAAARTCAKRQAMERMVLQSLCMLDTGSGQWRVWDSGQNRYGDIRASPGDFGRYVTDNQILPIKDRVVSLATASQPDADFSGITTAERDQQAAEEASGIAAAWEADYNMASHLLDEVDLAVTTSTLWAHPYWDKNKRGLTPETGADGLVRGAKEGTPGGVTVDCIPWYEGFPYADTTDARDMRGFIIAKLLPLTELVQRYGKVAEGVEPDAPGDTLNYFQSRYSYLAGNWDWQPDDSPAAKRSHVTCYELMEPGTPRYPKGLRLVAAGDRLLLKDENPDWDALPLIPLAYGRAQGTPWGRNAIAPLCDHQRAINRAWTAALDVLERQKLYLVVQDGTELDPDAYSRVQGSQASMRDIVPIRVGRGAQSPQFQLPPAPSTAHYDLIERLLDHMKAISGIRDAVAGQAPSSDSGIKVQLLQQAAKAQLALLTQGVERYVQDLMAKVIDLYAAHAKATQLVALSPEGDEQARGMQAMALKSLTGGGKVRVRVTPGSAMPKLPESQDEDINAMAQAGLFQPQNLPQAIVILRAKSWSGSSPLAKNLLEALEVQLKMQQQNQPDPAAVQAQQAQAQAAQQQAQQQHDAEMQAMADHTAQMTAQLKQNNDAQLAAINHHNDLELEQAKHQNAVELLKVKAMYPAVSLAGKMGALATESAEREVGLESDTAHETQAQLKNEKENAQSNQKNDS